MEIKIFEQELVYPFKVIGLNSEFFGINLTTLIYTWIAMAIIFVTVFVCNKSILKREKNLLRFIIEKSYEFLFETCHSSLGSSFHFDYFVFTSSIFVFTLFLSLVGLLPFVDEATKDLNTALAISVSSFFYVQMEKIKAKGIKLYLQGFTEPFFVLLPLNLVGEVAKIASMAFRLFGNILGGSIIFYMVYQTIKLFSGAVMLVTPIGMLIYFLHKNRKFRILKSPLVPKVSFALMSIGIFTSGLQLFFGLFESFIQAFVIMMLTITYIAVGVSKDENDVLIGE